MPDILAPNLDVLFCGINPSVYSVVIGHHFGRPGNRFWGALFGGGFTPRLLRPDEDALLPSFGLGITNVCARSSVAAAELSRQELREGGEILRAKTERFRPKCLAVLGVTAFREAFENPEARFGWQEKFGQTRVYVLPNPSGLNAHFTPKDLTRVFGEFRRELLGDFEN